MSEAKGKFRFVKGFLLVLAAAFVGLLIFGQVGKSKGNTADAAMKKAFAETLGAIDRESMLTEFPPLEANQSLGDLQKITVGLGASLINQAAAGEDTELARENWAPLRDANLTGHFRDLAAMENNSVAGLAPAVIDFLNHHEEGLSQVVGLLNEGETPVYLQDISRGVSAPLPNLLGQMNLQRLLLARVLAADSREDHEMALETMKASIALNRSIQGKPELISQLIAVAVVNLQTTTLRHVTNNPTGFADLFEDPSYGPNLDLSLRGEFFVLSELSEKIRTDDFTAMGGGGESLSLLFWGSTFGRGWMRRDLAETGVDFTQAITAYKKTKGCITQEQWQATFGPMEASLEGKTPLVRIAIPNVADVWQKASVSDRGREMTIRILRLRAGLAAFDELPTDQEGLDRVVGGAGLEKSGLCGGASYVYRMTDEGGYQVKSTNQDLVINDRFAIADSFSFTLGQAPEEGTDGSGAE